MPEHRTCPTCGGTLPPDAPEGTCPKCLLAAGFESADGGGDAAAPDLSEVAREFPDLEILEELGRGGMGVVYKARQKRLDRLVALKVLPREIAASAPDAARFEDRFTREARALARLSHPNIVAVHEFGERDGLYYFLMEYVDGANLRQAMRAGRLSPAEALAIVPQICDALQFAHDQGVVHRDIKPENVLLDVDGKVKIADFGLAKLVTRAADDRTLTRQGLVMGTPHYMAPEQLERPSEVDHRADIYSLGVVLYEMLTGELPLGRFAPPSEKVQVDVRLDEVVLRSLEKEADRRYQAVSDVKTGIGAVDLSKPAHRSAAGPHPVRPNSRHSKLAFWGLLLPLIAIAVATTGLVLAPRVLGGGMAPSGLGLTWMVLTAAVGLAVVTGIVLSIIALFQIKGSEGRLHGTGLAVAGLLVPLFCCVPAAGVPFFWLSARSVPATITPVTAPVPGYPDPTFEPPSPPPFLAAVEHEDLGEFRVEMTLAAGEAGWEPQRLGILGLGDAEADADMSTSSEPTWPPEPGTLVHLRGVQRRQGVANATATLLLGDEVIAELSPEGGETITTDVYVSADRADEIRVEFDGMEEQRVAVFGRVVRSGVTPPPYGQKATLTLSVPAGVETGDLDLSKAVARGVTVEIRAEQALTLPLEEIDRFVAARVSVARGGPGSAVRVILGGHTVALPPGATGKTIDLDDVELRLGAGDIRIEGTGDQALTVRIWGRLIRRADGGR